MIITLLLLSIFIILLHYYIIHHGKYGRLINLIPGSLPLPLIGNLLEWYTDSQETVWKIIRKHSNKYYPIYRAWDGTRAYINIRHPDDMETLLNNTKHIDKDFFYEFICPWLGTGLLTSTGMKWHKRRKILTPTFHFHILKQFIDILIEESNRMTKSLKDIKGEVVEDLVSFISHHTLNAICKTAMGTSLQDIGMLQQQYRQAINEMSQIMFYRNCWKRFPSALMHASHRRRMDCRGCSKIPGVFRIFYLWGHLKTLMYDTPVATVEVLRIRIIVVYEKIRNTPGIFERLRQYMRRRCEACINAEGNHFQQFL